MEKGLSLGVFDKTDFEETSGAVGADEHGHVVVEVEHVDGVSVGVQHVGVVDAVFAGMMEDERITHSKLPCVLGRGQATERLAQAAYRFGVSLLVS